MVGEKFPCGCQPLISSPGREFCGIFFIRALTPFMRAPPSGHNHPPQAPPTGGSELLHQDYALNKMKSSLQLKENCHSPFLLGCFPVSQVPVLPVGSMWVFSNLIHFPSEINSSEITDLYFGKNLFLLGFPFSNELIFIVFRQEVHI